MVEAIVCRNIQNRQKKKNKKSKLNKPNPADTKPILQDKKQKKKKRGGTKGKRLSKLHDTNPRTRIGHHVPTINAFLSLKYQNRS